MKEGQDGALALVGGFGQAVEMAFTFYLNVEPLPPSQLSQASDRILIQVSSLTRQKINQAKNPKSTEKKSQVFLADLLSWTGVPCG